MCKYATKLRPFLHTAKKFGLYFVKCKLLQIL